MTRASQSRRDRKSALKNVIQMPGKNGLKLNEDERMRLENCTLKLRSIQDTADKQAAPVFLQQNKLVEKIDKRLGISLAGYNINLDTGDLTPRKSDPAGEVVGDQATAPPKPDGKG